MWSASDQANAERLVDQAGTLNCNLGQRGGWITGFPDPAYALSAGNQSKGGVFGSGRDSQDTFVACFHPTQDPISSTDGSAHAMGRTVVAVDLQNVTAGGDLAGTLDTTRPSRGGGQAVAYDILGTPATNGAKRTDVHTALRGRTPGQSEASTTTVVAFREPCPTLTAKMQGSSDWAPANEDAHLVGVQKAVAYDGYNQKANEDISPSVRIGRDSGDCLVLPMAVRRLTPRECERLQGFPDDYTLVTYRGKPACDGPRYRALGNSMAVPVMRWIGERIRMVEGQ